MWKNRRIMAVFLCGKHLDFLFWRNCFLKALLEIVPMKISYQFKTLVWSLFRRAGYEIFPRGDKGSEYETIRPTAMYSPWNVDALFQEHYQAIKENTLVDIFRCYGLW